MSYIIFHHFVRASLAEPDEPRTIPPTTDEIITALFVAFILLAAIAFIGILIADFAFLPKHPLDGVIIVKRWNSGEKPSLEVTTSEGVVSLTVHRAIYSSLSVGDHVILSCRISRLTAIRICDLADPQKVQ